MRKLSLVLVAVSVAFSICAYPLATQTTDDSDANITPALDAISQDSLTGNLSFLASDLLEGRATPSPGLTIAAEYIAAQFRKASLHPLPGKSAADAGGYFQTVELTQRTREASGFKLSFATDAGRVYLDDGNSMSAFITPPEFELQNAAIYKIDWKDEATFPDPVQTDFDKTILLADFPAIDALSPEDRRALARPFTKFSSWMRNNDVRVAISVIDSDEPGSGIDDRRTTPGPAMLMIHDPKLATVVADLPMGETDCRAAITLDPPTETQVAVHNVIGILPGSDDRLKNEYVLVTAHYDHVGRGRSVDGDNIYNGANDDASGVVSVIEIANAFAHLERNPKRTIVFMCFYGEESGLLGSRHYGDNPVFPLEDTVAMINLEHLGRTDDSEGESMRCVMPTGFDYSNVVEPFVEAGEETGIDVVHHPRNSASFFSRSDNIALAMKGVPAHTFCAAFIFPDYHGAADHWQKIDYANLTAINRMLTLGIYKLANQDERPKWNTDNSRADRYREARD